MTPPQDTDAVKGQMQWSYSEHDGCGDPYFLIKEGSWDICHNKNSVNSYEIEKANAALIVEAVNFYTSPELAELKRKAADYDRLKAQLDSEMESF